MSMAPASIQTPDLKRYSRRLFLFILSIILLMSLLFIVASSTLIERGLDGFYNGYVDLEITYLEDSLNESINSVLSTMNNNAKLPMVVNSVMHPEHDHRYLRDFMENLLVHESRVDYFLLDINGSVIQSNAQNNEVNWRQRNWVEKLVDGELTNYVEYFKDKGTLFSLLAVPVYYNNYPEGVLVGVIPSNLDKRFSRLLNNRPLFATIRSNGVAIHEIGTQRNDAVSRKQIDLPIINGTLVLEIYKTEINQILFNLRMSVLVVVALFSLLIVFVFKRLGFKLFIQPQELIEQSMNETIRANQKLSVANDELAQFAYRASHDLKAPLVTTRGLADFICMDLESGDYDEVRSNANKISDNVTRLEKLVTDILDLARADLEVSSLEQIDLRALVDGIKARLEKSYKDSNVSIEVEISEPFELVASRTRITQVLENLISNAIKYYDPEKPQHFVKVSATSLNEKIEIKVCDNGLGIPDEFRQQVFKMFQRFHPNVSYGSGLGMYIIKKHIDSMSADMRFTSSPAGTEFSIALPQN